MDCVGSEPIDFEVFEVFPASPGLPPSFCNAGQIARPEVETPLKWNGNSPAGTFVSTGMDSSIDSDVGFSFSVGISTAEAEIIGIMDIKTNIATTENLDTRPELITCLPKCSLINLTLRKFNA